VHGDSDRATEPEKRFRYVAVYEFESPETKIRS